MHTINKAFGLPICRSEQLTLCCLSEVLYVLLVDYEVGCFHNCYLYIFLNIVEYFSIYLLVVSLHEGAVIDLGVEGSYQVACVRDHIFSLSHSSLLSFELVKLGWNSGDVE